MAKLLFMGVRGSADPTNAAMPFIMANGAVQAGHETQIVLANEAVDLMSRARGVTEADLEGKNAEYTTPPKIADLLAWADSTASF